MHNHSIAMTDGEFNLDHSMNGKMINVGGAFGGSFLT